ncbi:MAG: adenylate/guanylate cyclase domain-containing protein [Pseudomonadota bacterium]
MARADKINNTIVFLDIDEVTALFDQTGDELAMQCIAQCIEELSQVVVHHQGIVVEDVGRELLCRFEDADLALIAGQAAQLKTTSLRFPINMELLIRVGVHCGEVIVEGDAIFGDTVNVAARMADIARGGQIIVSEAFVEQLSAARVAETRQIDLAHLKGKREKFAIYEVLWEPLDSVTRRATSLLSRDVDVQTQLRVKYRDRSAKLMGEGESISIGRGGECDLVIDSELASRTHALCEMRRGKLTILDQSTNGTYVTLAQGEEIYLRRESLVLQGKGTISLGKPAAENDSSQLIHYSC